MEMFPFPSFPRFSALLFGKGVLWGVSLSDGDGEGKEVVTLAFLCLQSEQRVGEGWRGASCVLSVSL